MTAKITFKSYIDIRDIEATYIGGGTSSFPPRMLLKVMVYADLCNVYSGRRMERLVNVEFGLVALAHNLRKYINQSKEIVAK